MKLTPAQRKERLHNMMAQDPNFMRMKAAYDPAKSWFQKFTACLPGKLRNRLREYPGMMFFMHSRMIETICSQMRFQDED